MQATTQLCILRMPPEPSRDTDTTISEGKVSKNEEERVNLSDELIDTDRLSVYYRVITGHPF